VTAAAVRAAFPKGDLSVDLRAEFGTLYTDQLFAALYPPEGRPGEVAPWRWALVVVMQYMAGRTDRQAADAVRRCMDGKYALRLDVHDPGFDCTLWHAFRERLVAHEAGQRCLDTFLTTCKARGGITARGTPRTDAPHVRAAIRTLHRLECALEAMPYALNQLSAAASAWVQQHVPLDWYTRDGLRADQMRLPQEASKRAALARQVGMDGYQLLDAGWAATSAPYLRPLPALEALRQIWVQQYYRCSVPGRAEVRWRTTEEPPPAAARITSPYELEARYGTKRDTQWVGSKLHLTETGEPAHPDLITQGLTTPSTTPGWTMGPPIVQELAARDLLPGTHLFDSGDVDADFLVTAQQHQIDVVGPPLGASSWQHKRAHGYDLQAFVLDWDAHQARCPQGHTSVKWPPGHEVSGDPVLRIRFDRAPWRACPTRQVCTTANDAPRQLTVRPQAHHEAMQAARQRQETPEFKEQYARRSGVEGSLSQGIRRFDVRQSRYRGFARTHLQQRLNATAMNIVRVIAWLKGEPLGERRRKPGYFARLAPHPLSRQAVIC
jgi:transposase